MSQAGPAGHVSYECHWRETGHWNTPATQLQWSSTAAMAVRKLTSCNVARSPSPPGNQRWKLSAKAHHSLCNPPFLSARRPARGSPPACRCRAPARPPASQHGVLAQSGARTAVDSPGREFQGTANTQALRRQSRQAWEMRPPNSCSVRSDLPAPGAAPAGVGVTVVEWPESRSRGSTSS